MIFLKKYCIIGKDERSLNLIKKYKEEGKKLFEYSEADVIITTIPFSRDEIYINTENIQIDELVKSCKNTDKIIYTGALKNGIVEKFKANNIKYVDLMDMDELAILNAIPTAEGAIYEAIANTKYTLNGSNILITGFGRIGKVLSNMLTGFGANIFCEARNKKDIALIKAMGYNSVDLNDLNDVLPNINIVFNTIPYMIFNEDRLSLLKETTLIIDLASNPGGVDFEMASKMGINVKWALALPSKVAPDTSASYIKNIIDNLECDRD